MGFSVCGWIAKLSLLLGLKRQVCGLIVQSPLERRENSTKCPPFSKARIDSHVGLREHAGDKKTGSIPYIGASLDHKALKDIPGYGYAHAHHYNMVTMDAGECQWVNYEKDNGEACHFGMDYAEKHKIAFRFHSLIWLLHGYPENWVVPEDVRPAKGKTSGGGGGTRFRKETSDDFVNDSSDAWWQDAPGVYPESLWAAHQAGTLTIAHKKKKLQDHVWAMVTKHKGRVHSYDVVNEAVCNFGAFQYNKNPAGVWLPQTEAKRKQFCFFSKYYNAWLKKSLWAEGNPQTDLVDFIDIAFRTAHTADPKVMLCYNDYEWESNWSPWSNKVENVHNLLKGFQQRGVPIDCAGFQSHIDISYIDRKDWLKGYAAHMDSISKMGLKIMITEFEAKCSDMHSDVACHWDERHDNIQAALYREVLHLCLHNPSCISFESFGWDDNVSFANTPTVKRHPYPFDACMEPKPAFYAMVKEFKDAKQNHGHKR